MRQLLPSTDQKSHSRTVALLVPFLLLSTIIFLLGPSLAYYPLKSYFHSQPTSSISFANVTGAQRINHGEKCNIFSGEWVRNMNAPYYTNVTCHAMHEYQNCMKYGRSDTDYLKWRWQPDECELPIFNPVVFLEMMRNKSIAFVGDSISRNHMQSLICLLSKVENPIDESYTSNDQFKRWKYKTYNFTLATFWTPFLAKSVYIESLPHVYLDEQDPYWTTQIEDFSYVIISGGHWFFNTMIYHEQGRIVGCNKCQDNDLGMLYGYRKAMRLALKAINELKNYKGVTFLRTFSPSHFENGVWDNGGICDRKMPYLKNETSSLASDLETYVTQLEEFKIAESEGKIRGLKFRLLDLTQVMLMRPDGHPSKFGHWFNGTQITQRNDCVHWCLPGPIDNWNDFLLEMLKMEVKADP